MEYFLGKVVIGLIVKYSFVDIFVDFVVILLSGFTLA